MLRIGICDDSAEARQHMLQLCQKYYENNTDAFEYKMYKNSKTKGFLKHFIIFLRVTYLINKV